MNYRVFITDGHWRKSLAAVRGLGRKGISVTVGESTFLATAAFSRYCRRRIVYPSVYYRPSEFLNFLENELALNSYQMLLPMEEDTLLLISEHYSDFAKYTYLPIPSFEKLEFARRKDNVLRFAENMGIPVPRTWYIDDISQLDSIRGSLAYPAVIKPKTGSGAEGISYPENSDDLVDQYLKIHSRFPFPLIQELVPKDGPGYGVSLLMGENGNLKASFVHRRLREYPVTGGASTLRESVRCDGLRDMAVALMKKLDWFGVAMVEFKFDSRDNTMKLMEINPRFWGSLSLAIEAGVNFPYLMFRMSRGQRFEPVENYQTGKRCRWLLPGDILHFIFNPGRKSLLPGFLNFWDKNTAYDILSAHDPLPVLGRILTPLTFIYDRDMRRRLKMRK
ncbi:MAG: ATP-grasp domain-containing protein [Deltaproteobacteria bacterium]|nr:ATP-grasp domain-containing protein [Deltaproteobacteria bacterium]